MEIFLANKEMQFNVGLKEIEQMTPQQAYLFQKELKKAQKELERVNLNNGRY